MTSLSRLLLIAAGTVSFSGSVFAAESLICKHSILGDNTLTITYAERKSGYEYLVTNENASAAQSNLSESLNLTQLTHSDDALHGDKGLRTLENLEYLAFEVGGTGDYVSISFDEQIIRITDATGERVGVSPLDCKIQK